MASILKVTCQWSGFVGAPGYSNFYWKEDDPTASFDSGAIAAATAVNTFFGAIKAYFPNQVNWRVLSDVPVIDENTGTLTDIASAGTFTPIVATGGTASYSAATGAVITWRTGGVRNGRRVRGRTFLVPTSTALYDVDGSLHPTGTGILQAAATALINTAGPRNIGVWARPSSTGASDGAWHPMLTASIPDKVAVLKSRRD